MSGEQLRVSEIFGPTIQGEGAVIGLPTVFVRLGGCDFRCTWCDSLHAVLPEHREEWQPMAVREVADVVDGLTEGRPILVTLSGGNPALYNLSNLLDALHVRGHTTALETQGSKSKRWFSRLTYLTLSPKPPSAGNMTTVEQVATCLDDAGPSPSTSLKVVVFDDDDLNYAVGMHATFPTVPFFLQVGNRDVTTMAGGVGHSADMLADLTTLAEKVLARGLYNVRVLPQLHALMWGNARAR